MYPEILLIATKTAILLLGGSIAFFAYKAYRRTGDPSLRALVIGFSFVTIGALLGGIADQLLNIDLVTGVIIDSLLTAIGFAVIVYSLFLE
ncbi:DUF7521 family protein [Halalkalirubrum salinum]|uniref:DUF7521 family protein n=1 Tax=Halalkalirubrum salinum TaxID=2563889 RepID=UPI0010FBB916|nr:hypothetical protein [Halalkalirubrum salinum]